MWDRIAETIFYIALIGTPALVIAQIHYLMQPED
jgi:hypothetical protein